MLSAVREDPKIKALTNSHLVEPLLARLQQAFCLYLRFFLGAVRITIFSIANIGNEVTVTNTRS